MPACTLLCNWDHAALGKGGLGNRGGKLTPWQQQCQGSAERKTTCPDEDGEAEPIEELPSGWSRQPEDDSQQGDPKHASQLPHRVQHTGCLSLPWPDYRA